MEFGDFLEAWADRKLISGQSFNEYLEIDNIPIWWFYRRFFVKHVMPKHVNTFLAIENEEKINFIKHLKIKLAANFLSYYIPRNEIKRFTRLRKPPSQDNEPKALFLAYTNHLILDGSIFRIQNILNKLRSNDKIKDFVIFSAPLSHRDYSKLYELNNVYSYCTKDIKVRAKEISEKLYQKWKKIRNKKALLMNESKSYWPYLKPAFDLFFSKGFLKILVMHYETVKEIISTQNIKTLTITAENSLFERCLIAAAKGYDLPVLRLSHGPSEDSPKSGLIGKAYKLVLGEAQKNNLMENGFPKDKIIVVGPVIFDDTKKYISEKDKKEKNILIATMVTYIRSYTLSEEVYFTRIERILKDIKKIDGCKVRIKLHPRELPKEKRIADYERILTKLGFTNYEIIPGDATRDEFYESMNWCDVFVSFGSTASIEAMIIGRPVVNIDILGNNYVSGWLKKINVTLNLNHDADMQKAIETAIEDQDEDLKKRRSKYIIQRCGVIDGKAHERVANLIEKFSGVISK
jgi:hypothetical protein